MKIFKKMKKGFTLVELVVVIAVIAILAAVSVGAYFGVTESANASRLEQETKQIHTAIQTVSLAGSEHSSLSNSGLEIKDRDLFEDKLIESLGKEVFLTNVENEKSDEMPTIYFSSAEYNGRVENGTYKTFHYYLPDIGNKKAVADVVTGECKIADAGDTTIADPDAGKVWYLVKDASELKVTDRIVITAKDYNYALSTEQKTNNRGTATIERNENLITIGEDTQVITLEKGAIDGTFAFNVGEGYLYAAGNTSNYLKTNEEVDNNGSWTISIYATSATITASGDNSRNTLKFNNSNSPKLFSCYASDSTTADAVAIYKFGFYEEKECEHNFGDNLEFCSICGERNENYQAPTEPEVLDKSIPELKAITASDTSAYYVDGYITGWYGTAAGFGNFYIAEDLTSNADSSILVYGASEIADRLAFDGEKYSYESKQDFNYTDYKIGDYVEMKVIVKVYKEVNQLSGVILEKTHVNALLTLNITHGEDTRVVDLTNQEVTEVFENVSANDTFTAVVKDGENTVYIFDTFTADKAGKWSITYNFYDKTTTTNLLEGVSEDGTTLSTLSFRNEDQRTEQTADKQEWSNGVITLINEKASSTNAVADYVNPVRFYKGSTVSIQFPSNNVKEIKIESETDAANDKNSFTNLKSSLLSEEIAFSEEGTTITIENYTSNSLTFTCQDGQVRLYSISIKYGESIDEPVTPPEEPEQPTLYTLTITTDPADATVVLNAGEQTVNGKSIEVEENTTVTYTVSKDGYETVNGNITVTETTNLPITLEAKVEEPETPVVPESKNYTIDFAKNFATYAANWGTGYGTKNLNNSDLGFEDSSASVELQNTNKQQSGSTIDDLPVLASKSGDGNRYVTLEVTESDISVVSFELRQWTTKTFKTLTIEYSTDGSNWQTTGVGFTDASPARQADSVSPLSVSNLPSGVIAVRLVVLGGTTSNNQVGISKITYTK